jgi:hypothetical protein
MGFLKPLATHHCTPNHLEAIIRLAEAYTEESVQEKKQSTGPLGLTSLSHDDNTPKRSNIQLLEDEVEPSRLPNYVSSSDDDISTLEEEMNTHLTLTQPKQEEELLSS